MTIQRRGFAPAEKELKWITAIIVKYVYKGKDLRVALNEDYPMFNVADINVILGSGNLEGAVKRAKEEFWIEEDETGSEFERYAKFEEVGTPRSVVDRLSGCHLSVPLYGTALRF